MNRFLAILIGIVLLVVLLLFSMTYTVSFHEVAIKSTFGRSTDEHVITDPGLKFKLPVFADQVTKYDTRLQLLESPMEEKPTSDGQTVVLRAFLMWQVDVDNARQFHDNYNTIDDARPFLQDQFREALSAISRYRFDELVGTNSRLSDAEDAVLASLDSLREQGIKPVTVGISQFMLPSKATRAVLSRMKVARDTLSQAERIKGETQGKKIEDYARTTADKIVAFASQVAGQIRAESNEQKQEYLERMSDPQAQELAKFLVWVDALALALRNHTTLILPTSLAPFHLMDKNTPQTSSGTPQPREQLFEATPAQSSSSGGGADARNDNETFVPQESVERAMIDQPGGAVDG